MYTVTQIEYLESATIYKKSEEYRLGGCANVAINLSHFNLYVDILSIINPKIKI